MAVTKEQMYINDVSAMEHGIRMGDGFIDELCKPLPMKDYITNTSRLINGKQIIVKNLKHDSRSLTLTFIVYGDTVEKFYANKKWLYDQLYKGNVKLKVVMPNGNTPTFHLVYTGKSISYAETLLHTSCKVGVGFDEPDPTNLEDAVETEL